MKILFDLFITFAKMGAITFGGGYAMLPILQREVVEGKHWATDEELADYYAIGQCTPGIGRNHSYFRCSLSVSRHHIAACRSD